MQVGEVVDGLQVHSIRESSREPDELCIRYVSRRNFWALKYLQLKSPRFSSCIAQVLAAAAVLVFLFLFWPGPVAAGGAGGGLATAAAVALVCLLLSLGAPGTNATTLGLRVRFLLAAAGFFFLAGRLGGPSTTIPAHHVNWKTTCQGKFQLEHHNLMQQGHNYVSGTQADTYWVATACPHIGSNMM